MRLVLALLGFIVFTAVVFFVEVGVLMAIEEGTDRHIIPRGAAWVIIPIAAGVAGAKLTPELAIFSPAGMARLRVKVASLDRHLRLMLVGAAGWIVLYLVYWFLAEPFGARMTTSEWPVFFEILLIPPVAFVALYIAVLWALSGAPRARGKTGSGQVDQ